MAGPDDGARRAAAQTVVDGRARRWAEHNLARRAELVEAALAAIREHGPGVGMDEIAARAQTSKPVLYRHFSDRGGLYRAVAERVDNRIARRLDKALSGPGTVRQVLAAAVEAYLSLTEADPQVYRFVVRPPALEGSIADRQLRGITDRAAQVLADYLQPQLGPERARVWAVALVGALQASADRWLTAADPIPRTELVAQLTDFAADGLSAHLDPHTEET
ncbi:TetR family transcriptional regulator [Enemella dayhoffiae]|uniref:TetR family transcriptional regulator n=1 Tax=Enemella dayhoffiae TaxID=2016507 RepID=UPI001E4C6CC3|nr:TetR family transcriptional regulator [Enemella dayhoffiae]